MNSDETMTGAAPEPPQYRVIVSGDVLPEQSRAEALEKLAALFHSTPAKMEKLLMGKPVALTKAYSRAQAEQICRAIHAAGAACRMEAIGAVEVEILPPDEQVEAPSGGEDGDESDGGAGGENLGGDENAAAEDDFPADENPADENDAEHDRARQKPYSTRLKEAAVLRFVGVNIDYYRRQFARFGSVDRPAFALSWNWPAFFAFFLWAAYRKLWRWAGIHLLGGLALVMLFDPGFAYLAWALVWPLTANYLYYRHVLRRAFTPATHGDGGGKDGEAGFTPGGVSRLAVIIGMLVVFLSSMAFNHLITERVLQRAVNSVDEFLPGPGASQRGDGSVIDDLDALSKPAVKTVAILNIVATTIKEVAAPRALDDQELALSLISQLVERKRYQDGWGTPIAVRRDASGQVVVTSAGPDREFDTADDILQFIHLDDLQSRLDG